MIYLRNLTIKLCFSEFFCFFPHFFPEKGKKLIKKVVEKPVKKEEPKKVKKDTPSGQKFQKLRRRRSQSKRWEAENYWGQNFLFLVEI